MVTPFDARRPPRRGRPPSRLMKHLLDNGSDGLVLAGTTGEGSTLDDEEKLRLWQLAKDECRRRAADRGHRVERHRAHRPPDRAGERARHGRDAASSRRTTTSRTRAGSRPTSRPSRAATDKPIVVYNIPSRCVVDIPNDLLRELAEIHNVPAVKQARDEDIEPIEGLDLLAGNDDMLATVMDAGGTGGILVASHLFGNEMKRIVEEPDARAEVDDQLRDAYAALGVTVNPIPVKTALALLGLTPGNFRLPMVPASPDEEAEVRAMLERHGLLERGSERQRCASSRSAGWARSART